MRNIVTYFFFRKKKTSLSKSLQKAGDSGVLTPLKHSGSGGISPKALPCICTEHYWSSFASASCPPKGRSSDWCGIGLKSWECQLPTLSPPSPVWWLGTVSRNFLMAKGQPPPTVAQFWPSGSRVCLWISFPSESRLASGWSTPRFTVCSHHPCIPFLHPRFSGSSL